MSLPLDESAPLIDRLTHISNGVLEADAPVELHRRDVLCVGGNWVLVCSCGFVSTTRLTEAAAWNTACDVEAILADSGARRRQLQAFYGPELQRTLSSAA